MKIQYILEVFIICIFLGIPPLLEPYGTGLRTVSSYSWISLAVYAAAAVFLYIRGKWYASQIPHRSGANSVFKSIGLFAVLCANSAVWNIIQAAAAGIQPAEFVLGDSKTIFIINSLMGIIIFAFYEEALYRFFLPEALRLVSPKHRFLSETAVIILFALGHRYLGIYAVLNAACAGVMLRFYLIKTGSFASCTAVHAAYNTALYTYLFFRWN